VNFHIEIVFSLFWIYLVCSCCILLLTSCEEANQQANFCKRSLHISFLNSWHTLIVLLYLFYIYSISFETYEYILLSIQWVLFGAPINRWRAAGWVSLLYKVEGALRRSIGRKLANQSRLKPRPSQDTLMNVQGDRSDTQNSNLFSNHICKLHASWRCANTRCAGDRRKYKKKKKNQKPTFLCCFGRNLAPERISGRYADDVAHSIVCVGTEIPLLSFRTSWPSPGPSFRIDQAQTFNCT
jgi:hypothetical protein